MIYGRADQGTIELFGGSHMPLDTESHWSWRNPANLIPLAVLLLILLPGILLS